MNVFVLCTGRCGSTSFAKACEHISNYTCSHESRVGKIGEERIKFPDQHIEVDNRLAWFMGQLDVLYQPYATFYVWLRRNVLDTRASYSRRGDRGIMQAFRDGIHIGADQETPHDQVAAALVSVMCCNIAEFISRKPLTMIIDIEEIEKTFPLFWESIEAEGDFDAALAEFGERHNASEQ